MIRVLYFLNSQIRGEVEEHVLTLLKGLDRNTFIPTIVCPEELIDRMHEELKEYKVHSYPINIRKWSNFDEIKDFLILLRKLCPDIVHSHHFKSTTFAAPIAKYANVPVTLHTVHKREKWNEEELKLGFIEKFIYSNVDHVITVADAIKDHLTQIKDFPTQKIHVIRNGVDLEKFHIRKFATTETDDSNTRSLNVSANDQKIMNISDEERQRSDNKIAIGVCGSVEENKGHRYFLEAISQLGDKINEATFIIVGDGPLKLPLKELAERLKISNNVHFLGYKKYLLEVLNSLDIVVIPSIAEGLPVVALKAAATGKAIISTDVDGLKEVIINNETGLVVPARDSDAIKRAMVKLLNNKELRSELGKKANEYMEQNFDVKKQIKETEDVYQAALKMKESKM